MMHRFHFAALFAAIVVAVAFASPVATTPVHAQAPGGSAGAPQDGMASAKASLKARFGFTDAQATTAIAKVQSVTKGYQPKVMTLQSALQKKYGKSPTPEQRRKMQGEAMPLISEIMQKTNAALLSVATKEQRPKLEAQFKVERDMMQKMAKGG